ncbi:MAG: VWA domain-containing protein [Alphaproteobacteria bacterium]
MTFEAPWYAILLLALPLAALLLAHARRRKKEALERLIGTGMADVRANDREKRSGRLPGPWTLAGVIVCLTIALMQPLCGKRAEDTPRNGRDFVILLDTSLSMLAEDVAPNRIERAKAMIRRFVETVRADGGHRLALIAFAGRPSLQSPLTLDYDLFLKRLDETSSETVGQEGSLIGEAVQHALERLGGLQPGFADIILLTDGEDHGGLPLQAAAASANAGVDIDSIAIGSPGPGATIPVVDADGERRLLDYDGFEVRSTVQTELLAEMAGLTRGRFLGADDDEDSLARLYRETLAAKPKRALDAQAVDMPAQRFQLFVFLALVLLGVDQLWVGWKARTA